LKTEISLERKCEDSKYDFLIYPFHTNKINGLDICLKKHLVATCGHDNSIRIWNYHTKSLEICESFMDEPLTVAFHPFGLHLIVGFADKIRCFNICSRNLKVYQELFVKGCREIKFANGGHLFACADNHNIKVFRFYQGDCPEGYTFKEHVNKVNSINWFDDDTGFVSTGIDGTCIAWRLNPDSVEVSNRRGKEEEKVVKNYIYKTDYRNGRFLDVAVKSESKNTYYAITDDRHIKEIENGKERIRFDAGVNYSSIASFQGSKILVAGVFEPDKPGALQFMKNPWERLMEV
jgi:WD40 repeat protein